MTNIFIPLALLLLAFLAWRHPRHAIPLLVLIIPAYLIRFKALGIPTTLLEASTWLVFLTLAFNRANRREWREALSELPRPLLAGVLLFLLACAISVVISPETRVSLGLLKGWVISPLLLGWLVFTFSRQNKKTRRTTYCALVLSGVVSALFALSQLGAVPRLRGFYDVPNSLALWLAPLLVLTIWPAMSGPRKHRLHLLLALPMAAALLGSLSAAGILSAIISLILGALFWLRSSARRAALISLAMFLALSLSALIWSGRLSYLAAPFFNPAVHNSLSVRLQLWSVSLDLIKTHPVLGVGLGQFEPAYQQRLHERFAAVALQPATSPLQPLKEYVFRDPHNWLLSFWLNAGLLGLISVVMLINYLIFLTTRNPDFYHDGLTQALALSLLTIGLHGLVDTAFWKNDLSTLTFILFALLLRKIRRFRYLRQNCRPVRPVPSPPTQTADG